MNVINVIKAITQSKVNALRFKIKKFLIVIYIRIPKNVFNVYKDII